jgi:hypothetical protein
MNIMNHIIRSSDIIGISPLYIQHSQDQAMRSLYNTQRFCFWVHTKTISIEITSDYFNPGVPEMKNEKEREFMKAWETEYYDNRKKISELVGEPAVA